MFDEKSLVILYNSKTIIYFKCPASLSTNSWTFIHRHQSNVQLMDYLKAKAKFSPPVQEEEDKENEYPWFDADFYD